jgi:putative transposase
MLAQTGVDGRTELMHNPKPKWTLCAAGTLFSFCLDANIQIIGKGVFNEKTLRQTNPRETGSFIVRHSGKNFGSKKVEYRRPVSSCRVNLSFIDGRALARPFYARIQAELFCDVRPDINFSRPVSLLKIWIPWSCFKFAAAHASIHIHFNQDRHLNCRDIFKKDRAAALAEWRQLAV